MALSRGLHDRNMGGAVTVQKEEREVERLREQARVRAGRELLQVGSQHPLCIVKPCTEPDCASRSACAPGASCCRWALNTLSV